jgi:hypothetical protein
LRQIGQDKKAIDQSKKVKTSIIKLISQAIFIRKSPPQKNHFSADWTAGS